MTFKDQAKIFPVNKMLFTAMIGIGPFVITKYDNIALEEFFINIFLRYGSAFNTYLKFSGIASGGYGDFSFHSIS
jgi:hypothetical protein